MPSDGLRDAGAGSGPARWRYAALALVLYALLAVLLYLRAWSAPTHTWAGNLGDPAGFMWLLSRTPGVVTSPHSAFFTNNVNYPFGINLGWAPNVPLLALLAWPVTHFWGPVAAYTTLMTAGFALSAWAAFFAARRFVAGELGAVVAGLLYGFSPYMAGHGYGHLNITFVVVPPLLLLLLDEIFRRQRVSPYLAGVALAALAAAQFFISQEILLSSGVIALVGLVVLLLTHRREIRSRARYVSTCFAVALPIFALAVAYPLRIMFTGPQRLGSIATEAYVNDLLTFVVPPPTVRFAGISALASWRHWTGNPAEWNGYLGVPLLVLLGVAAFALRRDPRARFFAIMTALSALLSMGAFLHVNGGVTRVPLPWWPAANLPITRDMETARLMLYGYLFAGVLVAMLIDAWRPSWRRLAPSGALLVLAAATFLPRGYAGHDVPQPAFFATRHAAGIPARSVALLAPLASPANPDLEMFQPMLWLAQGNHYCIAESPIAGNDPQGRPLAGTTPTTLGQVLIQVEAGAPPPPLTPELRAQLTDDLRSRRVGTVVVGPMRHQAETVDLFTRLLGRPPELRDGVYIWTSAPGASQGPTGCA